MTNPSTSPLIDRLIDLQLERHGWLIRAGQQIRQWKEADRLSKQSREAQHDRAD